MVWVLDMVMEWHSGDEAMVQNWYWNGIMATA